MNTLQKLIPNSVFLTQVVILLCTLASPAQEVMQLSSAVWKLTSEYYRIDTITDDRTEKSSVGKIVQSGTSRSIRLNTSLPAALKAHLSPALSEKSENTVPLRFSIDKFFITDLVTGTAKHKITAELTYKFYREIDGKQQLLYESSLKPVLTATGNRPPGVFEKIIEESLAEVFSQFDQWTKKNHSNPYFMNHIVVRFENDGAYRDNTARDTLRWRNDYKLNWADFQGKDANSSPFSAQSNCIYTLKTIPNFSHDTLYVTEILHPCFTRRASWVKPDAHQDSLLMHEQLHFDLCELYARKFRKRLAEQPLSLLQFDNQIRSTFEAIWKEYGDAQQLYDQETEHGIVRQKQNKWLVNVAAELELLKEFGSD